MKELTLAQQLKENLEQLGEFLTEKLKQELLEQGHKDTGSLINSIKDTVKFYQNKLALEVEYNQYGAIINNGVLSNRVPYGGDKSGGGKSLYIQGLLDWVQRKGIEQDPKKALGVAIAIAKTQAKTGIPTTGSFKYSTNGRRIGFQDYVLSYYEQEIQERLSTSLDEAIFVTLDNILKKRA